MQVDTPQYFQKMHFLEFARAPFHAGAGAALYLRSKRSALGRALLGATTGDCCDETTETYYNNLGVNLVHDCQILLQNFRS